MISMKNGGDNDIVESFSVFVKLYGFLAGRGIALCDHMPESVLWKFGLTSPALIVFDTVQLDKLQ